MHMLDQSCLHVSNPEDMYYYITDLFTLHLRNYRFGCVLCLFVKH